jgi:hypothetical protein
MLHATLLKFRKYYFKNNSEDGNEIIFISKPIVHDGKFLYLNKNILKHGTLMEVKKLKPSMKKMKKFFVNKILIIKQ